MFKKQLYLTITLHRNDKISPKGLGYSDQLWRLSNYKVKKT